jgi:predicted dehydrogenase
VYTSAQEKIAFRENAENMENVMETIKWAVNATGGIAHQFAEGMRQVESAKIEAVSSTDLNRAINFAREFEIDETNCYCDLDEMLSSLEIDVVYICTPNHLHYEQCMTCFKHGVSVLCEKPLADTLDQTKELIEAARKANVFFLEGMWTRFFPVVRKVRKWLAEGKIGEPNTFYASFGVDQRNMESRWRYSLKASGGSLRDLGIYPIAFSFLVFGKPDCWVGGCEINNAGVDVFNNIMLRYGDSKASFMSSSLNTISPYDLRIVGSEGLITIDPDFWRPGKASLYSSDGTVFGQNCVEVFEEPYYGSGFEYEIMEVGDNLRNNKKESDAYTLQETLDITELMETIRKKWGIRYEADQ